MARSLNKVQLIGNLTRDPEMRYTPSGTAVATFTVATNRQWKTESGDTRDDAEFHRIVAWDKLAEICNQLLKKGRKVFVEGRLQTRKWQGQDGQTRYTTEVVISDMLLLDSRGSGDDSGSYDDSSVDDIPVDFGEEDNKPEAKGASEKKDKPAKEKKDADDQPEDDDIPF